MKSIFKLLYKKSSIKKILILIVAVSIIIMAFNYRTEISFFFHNLRDLSNQRPFLTAFIFIISKAISMSVGLPVAPLTLLSGSLFGTFFGTIIALIGNMLGATLAFLFSRYLLKEYIQTKILPKYPYILEHQKKLKKKTVPTVIALRLIPIFPFSSLNFLLGVTNISLKKYVVGSFIGMTPGTILLVYFGEALVSLNVTSMLIAIIGIILLTYIGKKYKEKF